MHRSLFLLLIFMSMSLSISMFYRPTAVGAAILIFNVVSAAWRWNREDWI